MKQSEIVKKKKKRGRGLEAHCGCLPAFFAFFSSGIEPPALPASAAVARSVESVRSAVSATGWHCFLCPFPGLVMDAVDLVCLRLDCGGVDRGAMAIAEEQVVGAMREVQWEDSHWLP